MSIDAASPAPVIPARCGRQNVKLMTTSPVPPPIVQGLPWVPGASLATGYDTVAVSVPELQLLSAGSVVKTKGSVPGTSVVAPPLVTRWTRTSPDPICVEPASGSSGKAWAAEESAVCGRIPKPSAPAQQAGNA